MFTGVGANYYATAYIRKYKGKEIVDLVAVFLNGASSLGDANKKNYGYSITQSVTYKDQVIWHNNHGYNAFVGNWNGIFPQPNQTTPYNDSAAEKWYDGAIPNPSAELPTVLTSNKYPNQFIDEILGWIYYLLNSIQNSNLPEINISNN